MDVLVKFVGSHKNMPAYASDGSAGFDLVADIKEEVTILPGETKIFPTGITIEIMEKNVALFVFPRSGLGIKHGITLPNCVGVIDNDYRGEIMVALLNSSKAPYTVMPMDRVAQGVLLPYLRGSLTPSDELSYTQRGDGGFGSSGR